MFTTQLSRPPSDICAKQNTQPCSPDDDYVQSILNDGKRFVIEFMDPIQASAMHVRQSAGAFVPSTTNLARLLRQETSSGPIVLHGRPTEWPRSLWVGTKHLGPVDLVRFSPDSRIVVSVSTAMHGECELGLWDVSTGAPIGQSLLGHMGTIEWVEFFPDSTLLASGSEYEGIQFWDTATCLPWYSLSTLR